MKRMIGVLALVLLAACTTTVETNTPSVTASGAGQTLPPAEGTTDPTDATNSTGAPEPTAAGASREAPIPPGQAGTVGKWDIKIIGATMNADDAVHAENMFNDKPKAGAHYVLITLKATYAGNGNSSPYFDLSWSVIADNGHSTEGYSAVVPNDLSNAPNVPAGANVTGNVVFMVDQPEIPSIVLYVYDFSNNGVFFSLGATATVDEQGWTSELEEQAAGIIAG